jgi:hypothetical protein
MTNDERKPPLQFGLRAMLGMMVAVSVLFGTMRWLGVSPTGGALVLVVLVLGSLAAVGLLASIANSGEDEQ